MNPATHLDSARMGSGSMDLATHLDSATRMGLAGSMDLATHLDSATRMNPATHLNSAGGQLDSAIPAELEQQMIIDETY